MTDIQRTFSILIQKPNEWNNLHMIHLSTEKGRTPKEAVQKVLNHYAGMNNLHIDEFDSYNPYGVTVTEFNPTTKKVLKTFQYTLHYPKEKW